MDQHIVSNVFGTLGAVCWSIQLAPQIILNYRRHSASGLSPAFMLFWAWAGIPLGVYNIVSGFNVALQVQPQILTALSLITWAQCYYYERDWTIWKATGIVTAAACVMGGIETGLVLALRVGAENGTDWPLTLMAVLAALFLALGVLEQYLAIWKNRSVEGISFLFCGLDALGDITSIISVAFESKLDVLALIIYSVELVLWMGVFAFGCYFKLIPWIRRRLKTRVSRRDSSSRGSYNSASNGIALHEMPSSTSVFRIASSQPDLRSRGQV